MFLEDKELTAEEGLDWILREANSDADGFYRRWLAKLQKEGVTQASIKQLNGLMTPLAASARPVIDPGTHQLRWVLSEARDWVGQLRDLRAAMVKSKGWTERTKEQRRAGHLSIRRDAEKGKSSKEFADALISDDLEDMAYERERLVAKEREILAYIDALRAHNLAYLISDGVLEGLRVCQRPECKDFYIGGPRAKWCSDKCGSIVRVKKKRKRDKIQGAMI
jgi:hypothetical protein